MKAYGVLMAVLALPACTAPTPLCFRPEVLQEVGRIVRGWNVYNTVNPYTVTEAPTTRANAVVCTASIDSIGYVPTQGGWVARTASEVRRYDVQVANDRFVVQVPR